MKQIYEGWVNQDGTEITFTTAEQIPTLRDKGLLSKEARLLHRIEADTPEEAQAVHHIKMGWSPYCPMGEAKPCPLECGSKFYPAGSGVCPNCGKIC
jgi:hypothetical protein